MMYKPLACRDHAWHPSPCALKCVQFCTVLAVRVIPRSPHTPLRSCCVPSLNTFFPRHSRSKVTDFAAYRVMPGSGRIANFYCVRLSHNGLHLKQLCDPGMHGDGTGGMTGVVRATVEEWWNDLKRGHFLDARARVMTIVLQVPRV